MSVAKTIEPIATRTPVGVCARRHALRDELLVASRPPPSVRRLARQDRPSEKSSTHSRPNQRNVRAVALTGRLLEGCYGSALYHSDP
jgi:hypothetical protein